jgi:hypothetical protein
MEGINQSGPNLGDCPDCGIPIGAGHMEHCPQNPITITGKADWPHISNSHLIKESWEKRN